MKSVIRDGARGVTLSVHVVPRSARNELVDIHGGALRIRLRAPPSEGAANAALVAFLAQTLGLAQLQVEILSGTSSRHKLVAISGVSRDLVAARLSVALAQRQSKPGVFKTPGC